MCEKINVVLAILFFSFFFSIESYPNETNKLKYIINNSQKPTTLIEKKISIKSYNFNKDINLQTEKKLDINYIPSGCLETPEAFDLYLSSMYRNTGSSRYIDDLKNITYLTRVWEWDHKKNNITPDLNIISMKKKYLDIKEIGIATSLFDLVAEATYEKNNDYTDKQQLDSSNKLFVALNEIIQEKHKLFIPDLVPIIRKWGKIFQINPLTSISDLKITEDDPNNIEFKFNISEIVGAIYFNKPEEKQYLSNKHFPMFHNDYKYKSFEINGDCIINLQTKNKEVRLFNKSGEVLFHLRSNMNYGYLSQFTVNDEKYNINLEVSDKFKTRYIREAGESVAFHERETYVLINNLTKTTIDMPNTYNVYIEGPTKYLSKVVSENIDISTSLLDIINESMQSDNSIEKNKLVNLLSIVREKKYNLFVADLIPLITKWGKRSIIHPLVKVDDISTDEDDNEITISFSISQLVSPLFFENPNDMQYISADEDSFCYCNIVGTCKINLSTKKRSTCLFDTNGATIYKAENF